MEGVEMKIIKFLFFLIIAVLHRASTCVSMKKPLGLLNIENKFKKAFLIDGKEFLIDPKTLVMRIEWRLVNAAATGDIKAIIYLLCLGVNINCPHLHQTPLRAAAKHAQDKVVLFLLRHAKIDLRDPFDQTALHHTFESNFSELEPYAKSRIEKMKKIITLLVTHGANVNALDVYKRTPCDLACSKNIPEICALFIELGAQRPKGCKHVSEKE